MTNAERQRRKRAKARKRKQSAEQAVAVERMLAPKPVVVDGPMLKVEHLRMRPVRCARWLREKLGRPATLALTRALTDTLADLDRTLEIDRTMQSESA